jgi:hypothetical protein
MTKFVKKKKLKKTNLIYENKHNYQEQEESGVARLRAALYLLIPEGRPLWYSISTGRKWIKHAVFVKRQNYQS